MQVLSESDKEELSHAQEKIRALTTELAMHDDALVQVAVLRKKIAASKERAQALVNMIDRRITYLCKLWDEYMAKEDDNEIVELAKTAVNDPLRISINGADEARFTERVNLLKDKVAELMLLDEQAAEAHKRAAEDNKTLAMAARRLNETEEHHKALLANNRNQQSEDYTALISLQKAITALVERGSAANVSAEEKSDSAILVEKLHEYVAKLPIKPIESYGETSATPGPNSRTSTGIGGVTASSSGISGTTVPTDESSSFFTTSSLPTTSMKNARQDRKWRACAEVKEITARSKSSRSSSAAKKTSTTGI
ncbi:unnamed protein product [Cylicocyclus nassatus]|uniref:Uncharacterized protein n=1 Tax=Cylicocyclus nassatus TaxID=53992 RepID=A0AA36GL96_CYLNA|nr:unnamed protein product [Cylicocyclus nassatus]